MQTEMTALMRAILLEPESDDSRLQYADLLEESGTPEAVARGRFIRLQCLLETVPIHEADYPALVAQEREILGEYWREWVRPICLASGEPLPIAPRPESPDRWNWSWKRFRWQHEIPSPRPAEIWHIQWEGFSQRGHRIRPVRAEPAPWLGELEFRRGFVGRVALHHKNFRGVNHLRNILDRTPVESLTLSAFPTALVRQALVPDYVGRLRSLGLIGFEADILDILRGFESGLSLRSLALCRFNAFGRDDFLDPLLDAGMLPNLREIRLFDIYGVDAALSGTIRSATMANVERLHASGCGVGDEVGRSLLESPQVGALKELNLSGHALSPRMVRRLGQKFGALLDIGENGG